MPYELSVIALCTSLGYRAVSEPRILILSSAHDPSQKSSCK